MIRVCHLRMLIEQEQTNIYVSSIYGATQRNNYHVKESF